MTLPRLLPFVSVHTENGAKLVLALLGPVVTTLLGHWRLAAARHTAAPRMHPDRVRDSSPSSPLPL